MAGLSEGRAREALIEAVAELCAERGYAQCDLAAVAARARVAEEEAARLFPGGLEECAVAAENVILLEVVTAVSRSYSADRSEWDNVIYGVKAVLEMMAGRPALAHMGYIAARQTTPAAVREVNRAGHQMLEAMLERGWEYSRRPHQPAKAALGVLGGAQALVRRELVAGHPERLPALLPECVYIATVPFLGQEEALRLTRQAEQVAGGAP